MPVAGGLIHAGAEDELAEVTSPACAKKLSEFAKIHPAQVGLLCIPEAREVAAAVDFIWREPSGLRLQPDWSYPAGKENESFEKWINGI